MEATERGGEVDAKKIEYLKVNEGNDSSKVENGHLSNAPQISFYGNNQAK